MKTLELITRLISFAVFLQGLEIILIRHAWAKNGPWDWEILRKEYSPKFQKYLSVFFDEKYFLILICIQISVAAINVFTAQLLGNGVLLFTTVLIAVRFRGTFNGGSDYMTTLILLAVFIAGFCPDDSIGQLACFAYIGIQTILSYFIAGLTKLKEKSWRNGRAIKQFLLYSNYPVDTNTKALVKKPLFALMASVIILLFECTFPLVLLDKRICLIYLCIGFLFHLENFFVLGLNRFVFAWLAAYPALYYLSDYIRWEK
ncbi:MAG: hypothetical protein V4596_10125 [Bdellovibrionota bacterium]